VPSRRCLKHEAKPTGSIDKRCCDACFSDDCRCSGRIAAIAALHQMRIHRSRSQTTETGRPRPYTPRE